VNIQSNFASVKKQWRLTSEEKVGGTHKEISIQTAQESQGRHSGACVTSLGRNEMTFGHIQ
jgi:hypothetical protein